MDLRWYLKRARAMSAQEIALRFRDAALEYRWRRRFFRRGTAPEARILADPPSFRSGFADGLVQTVDPAIRARVIASADRLLAGRWPQFAIERKDLGASVDWHLDARHGTRAPADAYSFARRGAGAFDIKYVWELSRHHHTTVCATAYWLTGEEKYAAFAADQIASWCRANLFLHGVHWQSGIEIGVRLISFVWTRRLLSGWSGAAAAFEANPLFLQRLYEHQWLLSRRFSYGSSANNHLILEAAGLFIGACAMPWYEESKGWREKAARILEREVPRQTFASGLNRELASEYHGFVLEAALAAALEGDLAGRPLAEDAWSAIRRMCEALAALADCAGQPPRQGDGDDAHALLLDAPDYDRWADLLATGAALNGEAWWWPRGGPAPLRSTIQQSLIRASGRAMNGDRQRSRMALARDAGLAVLRGATPAGQEIYCAFDAGPLGYLSIAAHGHADALSLELRVGGQPVLVDPGTYNYHAAPEWRGYFRSTAAHNTLELAGHDQSVSGGAFLWTDHAGTRLLEVSGLDEPSRNVVVLGEHEGYLRIPARARHRRRITFDRSASSFVIEDEIETRHPVACRMMFHMHTDIVCVLNGARADLRWNTQAGAGRAVIDLPSDLDWVLVQGQESPPLGWYSPSYDRLMPTSVLVGSGRSGADAKLSASIHISD